MINWYPGHMAKAKKIIKENIKLIDIVYILIDSRMPYSSLIDDFNDLVKNKKRIYIFTKYDICDKKETDKWIKKYEKDYPVLKVDLKKSFGIKEIIENSIKLVNLNRKIRALVIGVPNVGKSTLINRFINKNSLKTGNIAGVTKANQWIRANEYIDLLDTPGLLLPKIDTEERALTLSAFTSIKENILPLDDVAVFILKKVYELYPENLKARYEINNINDIEEAYIKIGKKRGCLLKKKEIDYDKVTKIIINDLRDGYLGDVTFDRINNYE